MKRYRISAERASLEIADRLVEVIVEGFWLLGEYPESGRACEEIAPGVRCFPAGKYLIYYRKMRRWPRSLKLIVWDLLYLRLKAA